MKTQRGFTLIEMMVAVSIFTIVMVISSGSLFSILDANSKSQSLKSVMNNLNLALEGMSRGMRMGSSYHCGNTGTLSAPQDCVAGSNYVVFEPSGGDGGTLTDQVVYRLNNNQIERSTSGGGTGSFLPITAPEVVVENMQFYVTGTAAASEQPKVVIIVEGHAGVKSRVRTDFNIQTVVSQRLLDISP